MLKLSSIGEGKVEAELPSRAQANCCVVQHSELQSSGTLSASASTAVHSPPLQQRSPFAATT
jgi:hypothetical protein